MARPRGEEWLEEEVEALWRQKVGVLVSLLEPAEVAELGLGKEAAFCTSKGIEFLELAIPDRNVPRVGEKMESFIRMLEHRIDSGFSVVIHCRMGIGRSSIVAGSVLLLKGWGTNEIIRRISEVRGLKVPDTEEQVRWLKEREKR